MDKEECPCKDCITFSICKIKIYTAIFVLVDNCSLLDDYIINKNLDEPWYYNRKRYQITLGIFGVKVKNDY